MKMMPQHFWSKDIDDCNEDINESLEIRKQKIEDFVDSLITTSPTDIRCDKHLKSNEEITNCPECLFPVDKASK